MEIQITKEQIDEIFGKLENKHQWDVLEDLYRMVFPDYDQIETIGGERDGKHVGWPEASEDLNEYIFQKFIAYDKQHHPDVFAGGIWMNNGFSYISKTEGQGFWIVPCPVTMKELMEA